jgi:hypothetical protein
VAAGDAAGTGSGKVRGVRKDAEGHLGRAEDFLSVGVGGGVAEEAVESGDGGSSGRGLFGGQGTGCRQDTGIHCPTIVKQIANDYLQFFGLAGSGWGRVVEGGWRLWGSEAVGGRGVDGGGGSVGNAGGTEAGMESGYISGVRNREGAGRAVVVEREAEKFSSDGVGFGVV